MTLKLRPVTHTVRFCILSVPDTCHCGVSSPDDSSVLPAERRATKCGQHGSLEIPITDVELLEMTFTVASHMNTAAEL